VLNCPNAGSVNKGLATIAPILAPSVFLGVYDVEWAV
jgi:hypothetical protein